MTEFIFQGRYLFNSELHFIKDSVNGEVKVRLNAPSSKCLLKLIQADGKIVSREELLEECWKNLIVTPNSLSQVITTLRKVFRDLDSGNDVIITVSRKGYRLSHTLEVTPYVHSENDSGTSLSVPSVNDISVQALLTDKKTDEVSSSVAGVNYLPAALITLFLLLPVISIATLLYAYSYFPEIQYVPFAKHKDAIVSIEKGIDESSKFITKSMELLNDDIDLAPVAIKYRYIYINRSVENNVWSYFLCPKPISKSIRGCVSFTLVDNYE